MCPVYSVNKVPGLDPCPASSLLSTLSVGPGLLPNNGGLSSCTPEHRTRILLLGRGYPEAGRSDVRRFPWCFLDMARDGRILTCGLAFREPLNGAAA